MAELNNKYSLYRLILLGLMIGLFSFALVDQAYAASNVTQGKPASCRAITDPTEGIDVSYMIPYEPSRAVDGNYTNPLNRWQTRQGFGDSYLQVDLGNIYAINRWVVYHQSSLWNNDSFYALKDYKLQKSYDGTTFTDVDPVVANNLSITDRTVPRFTARYLRVYIEKGCGGPSPENLWNSMLEFQAYGDLVSIPALNTEEATSIGATKATLDGTVVSDGNADITERGFVYSTDANPTLGMGNTNTLTCEGTTGVFSKEILSGLIPDTTYYFKAYAKNYLGIGYSEVKSFKTLSRNLTISPSSIDENDLGVFEINIEMNGETFKDAILDKLNFSISNMPIGMRITNVIYENDSKAKITLSYDGMDFDSNIENLTLTIDKAEITGDLDMTSSNSVTIVALDDDESIQISNNELILEGIEDGKAINVSITGGTFAQTLDLSGWTLTNLPVGVSAGSIVRQGNTSAKIILSGNSTVDYDVDIVDISVGFQTSQYEDSAGNSVLSTNTGVVFTATDEALPPDELILDTTTLIPDAREGEVYTTHTFSATGGTGALGYIISSGLLPQGMALSGDGILSGTPLVSGDYTFTVSVTDSATLPVQKSGVFTLKVLDKIIPIVTEIQVKTQPRLDYTNGETLDLRNLVVTLIKSDNTSEDVGFSNFGSHNISCDINNGAILGLFDNNKAIRVTHMDSMKYVETQTINVLDNTEPLALDNTISIPDGTVGKLYIGYGFVANGGIGSKEFTLESGALPSGLSLSNDGSLTGTPTDFGTSIFSVSVKDSSLPPVTTSGAFSITIKKAPIEEPIRVTKIEIKRQPKLSYIEREYLDLGELVITLYKSDGSNQDVRFNEFISLGIVTDIQNGSILYGSDNERVIKAKHIDSNEECYTNNLTVRRNSSSDGGNNNGKPSSSDGLNNGNSTAEVKNVNENFTTITKKYVEEIIDSGTSKLLISTPLVIFDFDKISMEWISSKGMAEFRISASEVEYESLTPEYKALVGDRPVYEFSLKADNKPLYEFGGNVTVTIPYTLKQEETAEGILVYYINNAGELEIIRNCFFDEKNNTVSFVTNHFSKYMIGFNRVKFNDVNEYAWYSQAVSFVSARGVYPQEGNGNYKPNENVTRAEFLAMIMKAYDINPDFEILDNFVDVEDNYYSQYLATAKKLGISSGIGSNKFDPNREISRQEMVTLLYNTLEALGKLPKESINKGIVAFSDADQVAPWANKTMDCFVKSGILNGSDDNKLLPKGKTSRAHMAQIIYNLVGKK